MRREDLARAVALVGARLRRDAEGERALIGSCSCDCRPLVDGLLMVVELSVSLMADHDQVSREQAAERTRELLRSLMGTEGASDGR
ncbi:hypothetical protein [Streptomyces sp. TP-A0356]|uniref:hypothetical protein n=1 Tax=Streptomyces sp. TP-A0356 TaxID=1359208 RepID=UPI0006E1B39D|nr:hypothetical protein [Streptomyces sp. TP-A0356]